jgi:hypothetical protein
MTTELRATADSYRSLAARPQTFGKFNVHCLALHEQFRSLPEKLRLHVSENLSQLAMGRDAKKKEERSTEATVRYSAHTKPSKDWVGKKKNECW